MTEYDKDQMEKAKRILESVYWDLMDNKEYRAANRLDTILGKLEYLQNMNQEVNTWEKN